MRRPLKNRQGFTIIEVMLFLSISGLMMMGVIMVISGSINRQRYNDAVYSTIDFLKHQYSSAASTHNNRPNDSNCIGGQVKAEESVGSARGTSNCYIVGRLVRTDEQAERITSLPVLATRDLTSDAVNQAVGEVEVVKAMQLIEDPLTDSSEFSVPYETYFIEKNAPQKRLPFAMLIVRLPTSNLVRTYMVAGANAQNLPINEIVTGSNNGLVCLESNGLVGSSNNGIKFTTAVSGASAIEFAPAELCS